MSKLLTAAAVAATSGVLWGLCFGREVVPGLGWGALVPLLALLGHPRTTRREALVAALVHGVAAWLVGIPWIVPTLVTFGHLPVALSVFLLVLLALVLTSSTVVFALLSRRLLQRGGVLGLVAPPALWVALEWLRGTPLGSFSFPWNLAGYAWVEVPGALPLSAWVGVWGISYLVLFVNGGLALALLGRRFDPALLAVLVAALVLALGGRFSRGEPASQGAGQEVRLVQPNQELLPEDSLVARAQYDRLMAQAEAECRGEPTLLVLPESAAWPHTWQGSWELRDALRRLAARGCDVVFNTPTADPERDGVYYNSALLVSETGPVARYDKRRLVPWGETVPLAGVLPFVGKLARHAGSFTPGAALSLPEWRGERLGLLICYEVVFPGTVAEEVREGATLLVNISNDAWYGDSSAPRQLWRAARFRAAENRRLMLRAALTGISGLIDRRGDEVEKLDLGRQGVVRRRLAGAEDLSFFTRVPWLVPLFCAVLAAFAIVLARRTPKEEETP